MKVKGDALALLLVSKWNGTNHCLPRI